jgi:hypothetical protein
VLDKSPVHYVNICHKKYQPQEERVVNKKACEICAYQYTKNKDRSFKEEVVPERIPVGRFDDPVYEFKHAHPSLVQL